VTRPQIDGAKLTHLPGAEALMRQDGECRSQHSGQRLWRDRRNIHCNVPVSGLNLSHQFRLQLDGSSVKRPSGAAWQTVFKSIMLLPGVYKNA
jgi:hypothetical protein